MTCFNNGLGRPGVTTNYSSADEFTPAVDTNGNYSSPTSGSAFLPANLSWTYAGDALNRMYSEDISGSYRLPNGNTLICSGTTGLFLEVTSAGEIVWKYICPVAAFGPMYQGSTIPPDATHAGEYMNSVFRIYRYPKDYAAFSGRTLTPGSTVEKYTTGVEGESYLPSCFIVNQNYPNPFNPSTTISYQLPQDRVVSLKIYDVLGKEIATLVHEKQFAGKYEVTWDASGVASGVYFYRLEAGNFISTKKLVLLR